MRLMYVVIVHKTFLVEKKTTRDTYPIILKK